MVSRWMLAATSAMLLILMAGTALFLASEPSGPGGPPEVTEEPEDSSIGRQPEAGRSDLHPARRDGIQPNGSVQSGTSGLREAELESEWKIPAAVAYSGVNAKEVLTALTENFDLDDTRVQHLAIEIGAVCGGELDPKGSVHSPRADSLRLWAVERLLNFCDGFDYANYRLPSGTRSKGSPGAVGVANEAGVAAGAGRAFEVIAERESKFSIAEAGLFLLEHEMMPLQEILGPEHSSYGHTDLAEAWHYASQLIVCSQAGGCGPQSFPTVAYCAANGCRPNGDLQSAYLETLPSRQAHLVPLFLRWALEERSGGP